MYTTDRLSIRPITEIDAPFLLELLNSPKWLKYIGDRKVHTVAQTEKYIRDRCISQYNRLAYGNFVVIRKSDNTKIGTVGIYDRPGLEGVDLGFAFLPAFENQGYGYEASKKVLDLAFSDFGIKEIKAITLPTNIASIKLIEKLGLHYVGPTRIEGDEAELSLYCIENS